MNMIGSIMEITPPEPEFALRLGIGGTMPRGARRYQRPA
jgi:hypothetical protein